ncbi:MAG: MFS transporter [Promethearchaeia archaeon]
MGHLGEPKYRLDFFGEYAITILRGLDLSQKMRSIQTALVTLMFLGLTVASALIIGGVINAEVLDYDELKTGKRREATYSGVNALILKPAISIANFIFLITINFFGFQEKSNIQSDEALLGIMVGFTILPAIFLLVSALIMSFFPLEGPEWEQKKLKIAKMHKVKQKEYKSYLKNIDNNIKKEKDKTTS